MDAEFFEQHKPKFLSSQELEDEAKDPYPAVPTELKDLSQWVLWKEEIREGKLTKVPKQAKFNENTKKFISASTSDSTTWTDYQTVIEKEKTGSFNGIGFVFSETDPYTGVDLDNCIKDGKVREWAQEILDKFKLIAYIEVSPSGNGLKMWTRAELPTITKHKVYIDKSTGEAIEAYDKGRYFTITGRGKHTIGEGQATINWLVEKHLTPEIPPKPQQQRPPATDNRDTADIQRLIENSRQRGKYHALMQGNWEGQGYGSHSEADIGLISLLCFWTQDKGKLDAIFRQSQLYRDKWDTKHRSDGATYGEMTIEKALSQNRETYTPQKREASKRKSMGFYQRRAKRKKYGTQR